MKYLCLLFVCLSMLYVANIAYACGGFLCQETETPVFIQDQKVIFTIDDDIVSMTLAVEYSGQESDFTWLIPVTAEPTIEFNLHDTRLPTLDWSTTPLLNAPRNYCHLGSAPYFASEIGHSYADVIGEIADFTVFSPDDVTALNTWLVDNELAFTSEIEDTIADYFADDMYIVAVNIQTDFETFFGGFIRTITLTYPSDTVILPLRLNAIGQTRFSHLNVWVFAGQFYEVGNYPNIPVDFSTFRAPSELRSEDDNHNLQIDYWLALRQIQENHDGLVFTREYAMPSSDLHEHSETIHEGTPLANLIEQYEYVTRFYTQVDPLPVLYDPIFTPAEQQTEQPRTVNLVDYVDPLTYWECSNQHIDLDYFSELLTNITPIRDFQLRYPEGWVRSQVTSDRDVILDVYAPQSVTLEQVRAALFHEPEFPMLLHLIDVGQSHRNYEYSVSQVLIGNDYYYQPGVHGYGFAYKDLLPYMGYVDERFEIITSRTDWAENEQLYLAIEEYLRSYEFYAHPEFQRVLVLDGDESDEEDIIEPLMIGFPDGWFASVTSERHLVIQPTDDSSLQVDLFWTDAWRGFLASQDQTLAQDFIDNLQLSDETVLQIQEYNRETCDDFPVVEYQTDERHGYMHVEFGWIVTVSATPDEFEQHNDLLKQIADTVDDSYLRCG